METKERRRAKVELLYEAIKKAEDTLLREQAKEWLKSFINEPWYNAAIKAYVAIAEEAGGVFADHKRRVLMAIGREELFDQLVTNETAASTTTSVAAVATGSAGTMAAQTITYYKTWEYLDERYNHVVVDDVRDELIELQKRFQQQLEAVYQKQLADTLVPEASKEMYQNLDMDFDFNKYDEATRDYLRDKKIHWAKQVADETEREIKAQLVKGYEAGLSSYDLAEQIKNSTGFSMHRAEAIARTEVLSACGYASYQAAMADDNIVGHYWRAQNSRRTRGTHRAANGQYRSKGEPFDVGGAQLLFPGDSSLGAPAKEIINCRCWLEMVFADEVAENKVAVNDQQEKYDLSKYEHKESHVDWQKHLGVSKETSDQLNAVHTDLNKFMLENGREKVALCQTKTGQKIYDLPGEAIDQTRLDKGIVKLLKDGDDNSFIMSHVHPSATSFSRDDIRALVDYKSISAITVEGANGIKFTMERGRFKASVFKRLNFDNEYTKLYNEAVKEMPDVDDDDKRPLIWDEFMELVNNKVAEHYGMKFSKVGE